MKPFALLFVTASTLLMACGAQANPLLTKGYPELKSIFDSKDGRICNKYRTSLAQGAPDVQSQELCSKYASILGMSLKDLTDPKAWDHYQAVKFDHRCKEQLAAGYKADYLVAQGCKFPVAQP